MRWKPVCKPLLWLAVVLSVFGCQQPSHKETFLVFGTTVQLEIAGVSAAKAQQASSAVQAMLGVLHQRWHAWDKGGLLAKINQSIATGSPQALDAEVVQFLQQVQQLSVQSGGMFNPAIGKLVALWGFHADAPQPSNPSKTEIHQYTQPPLSMASLRFASGILQSTDSRVQLDLGAIAKGYAVDLVVQALQQQGITQAVLNAGGDLRVLGTKAGEPWKIGVRKPEGGVLGRLMVANGEAVFSSGDYARSYQQKDKRRHHIIDPISGLPTEGLRAVTVLLPNSPNAGMRADAIATALLVAGKDRWRGVAENMGADTVLVIENTGELWMTKKMQKRFRAASDL